MALIEVVSVSKAFGGAPVLRDVSFGVDEREIVCLLGPSGCGKTTLLRIIAGLETVDGGQVLLEGHSLDDVPVHRRGFGLMFQDYALLPHRDVAANVAFGLRMQDLPAAQVQARTHEMLELVGLSGYERRRVYELSGGEQQRVALARSLAPRPRLLMLDEPLGSLDRALREGLMNELRAILRRVGVTTLYVTHDQQEAFAVADRVIILDRGRIVQEGSPLTLYHEPASPQVARFLGLSNLVPGRLVGLEPLQVETALGCLTLRSPSPLFAGGRPWYNRDGRAGGDRSEGEGGKRALTRGQDVTVLIRPEAARLAADCPAGGGVPIEGEIQESSFRGGHYRLVIRHASGVQLAFELVADSTQLLRPGEPISLVLRSEGISLLDQLEQ